MLRSIFYGVLKGSSFGILSFSVLASRIKVRFSLSIFLSASLEMNRDELVAAL